MGAVYAIADAGVLGAEALPAAVAGMAEAGIRWIQVRAKHLSGSGWHAALAACCRVVEGSGVRLWVDDRADLAALFPVEGVHVGQRDLPPAAARRVVSVDVRIGLSTHDEEQFAAADADPAVDVVAVGPVFPTTGKENPDPVVGLRFVRWARERTRKPLVAVGGIEAGNVAEVLAAAADAAAVLGAACRGGVREVRTNCLRLLAEVGRGG
ncbi:MAG: thiamine phosphate synthase [Thermoanaerobaculia bacterium]